LQPRLLSMPGPVVGHCHCASTIRGQFRRCTTHQSRENARVGRLFAPCLVRAMLSRITSDPLQRCDTIPMPRTHAQPAQHLSVGVLKRAWCGGARHVRHMVKARDAHNGQGTEPKRSRCAMACRMAVGCPWLRDESAGSTRRIHGAAGSGVTEFEGTDRFVPSPAVRAFPRCQRFLAPYPGTRPASIWSILA